MSCSVQPHERFNSHSQSAVPSGSSPSTSTSWAVLEQPAEQVVAIAHRINNRRALFSEVQESHPGLFEVEEFLKIARSAFELSDADMPLIGYGPAFLSPLLHEEPVMPDELSLVLDLSNHEMRNLKDGIEQLRREIEAHGFCSHENPKLPHQLSFSSTSTTPWRLRVILVTSQAPAPVDNFTDAIGVILNSDTDGLHFVAPLGEDPLFALQAWAEKKLYMSSTQAREAPHDQILLRVAQGWTLCPMSQDHQYAFHMGRKQQLLDLIHAPLIAPFQNLSFEEKALLFQEWKTQYQARPWWPKLVWLVAPHLPDAFRELPQHPLAKALLKLQKSILDSHPDHPGLFAELLLFLAPVLHGGVIDAETSWNGWRREYREWPCLQALSSQERQTLLNKETLGALAPLINDWQAPLPLGSQRALIHKWAPEIPLLQDILDRDAQHNAEHPDMGSCMDALTTLELAITRAGASQDLVLWFGQPFLAILQSSSGSSRQGRAEALWAGTLQTYFDQLEHKERMPPSAEELLSCPGLGAFLQATIHVTVDVPLVWPKELIKELHELLLHAPMDEPRCIQTRWSFMAWICCHDLDDCYSLEELSMSYWLLAAREMRPEEWALRALCTRRPSFQYMLDEVGSVSEGRDPLLSYAQVLCTRQPETLMEWWRVILARSSHDPVCGRVLDRFISLILFQKAGQAISSQFKREVLATLKPLITTLVRHALPTLQSIQLLMTLHLHSEEGSSLAGSGAIQGVRAFSSCEELQRLLDLGERQLDHPKESPRYQAAMLAWFDLLNRALRKSHDHNIRQHLSMWVLKMAPKKDIPFRSRLAELLPFCDWERTSPEDMVRLLEILQSNGVSGSLTHSLWTALCSHQEALTHHGARVADMIPLLGSLAGSLDEQELTALEQAMIEARMMLKDPKPLLDVTCTLFTHAPWMMKSWLHRLTVSSRLEFRQRFFPLLLSHYCQRCHSKGSPHSAPLPQSTLHREALLAMMHSVAERAAPSKNSPQSGARSSPAHRAAGSQDAAAESSPTSIEAHQASEAQGAAAELSLTSMETDKLLHWLELTSHSTYQDLFLPALRALADRYLPLSHDYHPLLERIYELLNQGTDVELATRLLERIPGIEPLLLEWTHHGGQITSAALQALAYCPDPLPAGDYSALLKILRDLAEGPEGEWVVPILSRLPNLDEELTGWIRGEPSQAAYAALTLLARGTAPLHADFQWACNLLQCFSSTSSLLAVQVVDRLPEPTRTQALFEAQRLVADAGALTEGGLFFWKQHGAQEALHLLAQSTGPLPKEILEEQCLMLIEMYGKFDPKAVLSVLRRHRYAISLLLACIALAQQHPSYTPLALLALNALARGSSSLSIPVPNEVWSWMLEQVETDALPLVVSAFFRFSSTSEAKQALLLKIDQVLLQHPDAHADQDLAWDWASCSLFLEKTSPERWERLVQTVLSYDRCDALLIADILQVTAQQCQRLSLETERLLLLRLQTIPPSPDTHEQLAEVLGRASVLISPMGHTILELLLRKIAHKDVSPPTVKSKVHERILAAAQEIFKCHRKFIDEVLISEDASTMVHSLEEIYSVLWHAGERIFQSSLSALCTRGPQEAWFTLEMAVILEQGLNDLHDRLFPIDGERSAPTDDQQPHTASPRSASEGMRPQRPPLPLSSHHEVEVVTAALRTLPLETVLTSQDNYALLMETVAWLERQDVTRSLQGGLLRSAMALPILLRMLRHCYLFGLALPNTASPTRSSSQRPEAILDRLWLLLDYEEVLALHGVSDLLAELLAARLQPNASISPPTVGAGLIPIAKESEQAYLHLICHVLDTWCAREPLGPTCKALDSEPRTTDSTAALPPEFFCTETLQAPPISTIPAEQAIPLLRYATMKRPSEILPQALFCLDLLLQPPQLSSRPCLTSGMISELHTLLDQLDAVVEEQSRQASILSPHLFSQEERDKAKRVIKHAMKELVGLTQRIMDHLPVGEEPARTLYTLRSLQQRVQRSYGQSPTLWDRADLFSVCSLIVESASAAKTTELSLKMLETICQVLPMVGDLSECMTEWTGHLLLMIHAFTLPSPLLAEASPELARWQARLLEALPLLNTAFLEQVPQYHCTLALFIVATHYERIAEEPNLLLPVGSLLGDSGCWRTFFRGLLWMFQQHPGSMRLQHFLPILHSLLVLYDQTQAPLKASHSSLVYQISDLFFIHQDSTVGLLSCLQGCIRDPAFPWIPELRHFLATCAYTASLKASLLQPMQPLLAEADNEGALLLPVIEQFKATFAQHAVSLCPAEDRQRAALAAIHHSQPRTPSTYATALFGATALLPKRDDVPFEVFREFGPTVVSELTSSHTVESLTFYLKIIQYAKTSCGQQSLEDCQQLFLATQRALSEALFAPSDGSHVQSITLAQSYYLNGKRNPASTLAQEDLPASSEEAEPDLQDTGSAADPSPIAWFLDLLNEVEAPPHIAPVIDLLLTLLLDPRLSAQDLLRVEADLTHHFIGQIHKLSSHSIEFLDMLKLALLCIPQDSSLTKKIIATSVQWVQQSYNASRSERSASGSQSTEEASRDLSIWGLSLDAVRLKKWMAALRDWHLLHTQALLDPHSTRPPSAAPPDHVLHHIQPRILRVLYQVHHQLPPPSPREPQKLTQLRKIFVLLAELFPEFAQSPPPQGPSAASTSKEGPT